MSFDSPAPEIFERAGPRITIAENRERTAPLS